MEDLDLKLKLFSGLPMEAGSYGMIDPLKVRDIISYGYTDYIKCLNIVALEKEDLFRIEGSEKDTLLKELEGISVFSILLTSGDTGVKDMLIESLSLFLGGEAIEDVDNLSVIIKINDEDYRVVTNDNFEDVKEVIKWQNYINRFSEEGSKFNPSDERARKLKERMDALKRKASEIKSKEEGNESDIDFYDIIEAIASKSYGINEMNVLDMTIYQVYRKLKRLEIIDEYDIGIKSLLAGASSDKVKLKHWSNKVD